MCIRGPALRAGSRSSWTPGRERPAGGFAPAAQTMKGVRPHGLQKRLRHFFSQEDRTGFARAPERDRRLRRLRRPPAHGLPEVKTSPGVVIVVAPDGASTMTTPHAPCGESIADGFTPGLSPRRSGGWGPARLTPDETPKKKINDNQELSSSRLLGPAGREDSEELGANDRPRGGLAQTTHHSSPARRRAFMGLKRGLKC